MSYAMAADIPTLSSRASYACNPVPLMAVKRVFEGVYVIPMGMTNAFLVESEVP